MLQQMKPQISLGLLALVFTLNYPVHAADNPAAVTATAATQQGEREARRAEQQKLDAEEKELCGKYPDKNSYCRAARSRAKQYAAETVGLEPLLQQLERIEKRLSALEAKENPGK